MYLHQVIQLHHTVHVALGGANCALAEDNYNTATSGYVESRKHTSSIPKYMHTSYSIVLSGTVLR